MRIELFVYFISLTPSEQEGGAWCIVASATGASISWLQNVYNPPNITVYIPLLVYHNKLHIGTIDIFDLKIIVFQSSFPLLPTVCWRACSMYLYIKLCSSECIIGTCTHGSVRVVNRYGTLTRQGNVELCINGRWRMVCANSWHNRDASVVCRELGYSPFGKSGVWTTKSKSNRVNDWQDHFYNFINNFRI